MSNSEQQSSASSHQQQKQQRIRKPPFADWPTIKILTPPQGRFSPKYDEWCFTYCSQTVSGRIQSGEPNCRTLCVRKVFPHEVRNVVSFKRHDDVGPDGKARYPLPSEGQAINLPRMLGGVPKEDGRDRRPASSSTATAATTTKYWEEGWYLWTGKGRWASQRKTEQMMLDLPRQQVLERLREDRKELWEEYQEQLNQPAGLEVGVSPPESQWWGPLLPPKTLEDAGSPSMLIPLPPDVPSIWDKVSKLLAPSYHVLGILHESVASGEQRDFALRVWEKAKSEEPFVLAKRSLSHAYEQWKKRDESEGDEKGST